MNFSDYLDVLKTLQLGAEIHQIHLMDGESLAGMHTLQHSSGEPALYRFTDLSLFYTLLCDLIEKRYTETQLVFIEKQDEHWQRFDFLGQDSRMALKDKKEGFIYFPAVRENSSLIAFQELVAHLRAPEGCPWDREQTHETLKTNLLEETYEVMDAIDSRLPAKLQEELGDLLLQIVLHAQISSETNDFYMEDIIQGIHSKITFRHPHVFKDVDVNGVKDVVHNWEILKSQERENNHTDKDGMLDSIPRGLPALTLAQKYQERAARVGFDWPEIEPVLDKVVEEVRELREAKNKTDQESELGDLFFALVNVGRWYGLNAEDALRKMTKRFYKRFRKIELEAVRTGRKITDLSLEEMDAFWELAKKDESGPASDRD
jgi:tetrapyrrole methylase family protein/MazG family protein